MTIETKPFDVVEVLNSKERISAYLEDAFESGDASIIASAIGDVVCSRSLSAAAHSAGVTRDTVSTGFSGHSDPTLSAITATMKSRGSDCLSPL